ncbi:MAG TPA: DUF4389 domain-containing protein [Baekduia sp.]|nr:DUF4389 domain-containing protein [Baekduia sp.]
MLDQPVFEAEYAERRSRLTTFFRLLLALPHYVGVFVGAVIAFVAVVIAWFSIVLTGQYPEGLYGYVAGFQRYATAVYGYIALLTDDYPPFSLDPAGYPVQLRIPPRKAEYNRMKTLFRIIIGIPVMIILYAMQIVWEVGWFLAWFVILVTGKQPKGLQDMIVLGLSYQQRAYCYLYLLTEDWPPFTSPQGGTVEGPAGGSPLPPAPPTMPAPSSPEAPGATGDGISSGDPLAR